MLEKKHIFKNRTKTYIFKKYKFKLGTSGLFSLKPQRFEFIYFRGLKKILRRRYIRRKTRFLNRRFWVFLRPNCILTGKSTNSRMGAGVGSLVRLSVLIKAQTTFVEFKGYSFDWIKKINKRLRYRYPLKFVAITK